jgi:catalase
VVDNLAHVDVKLARKVAEALGTGRARSQGRGGPCRLPRTARQGGGRVIALLEHGGERAGLGHHARVAVLVAPGVEIGALKIVQQVLTDNGVTTRIVGPTWAWSRHRRGSNGR